MNRDEFRQRIDDLTHESIESSMPIIDVIETLYSSLHRVKLLHDMEWLTRVRSEMEKNQRKKDAESQESP